MEKRIQALKQVIPCYFENLNQILCHLKSKMPVFSKKTIGFIHGDFIMNQILVDGNQIGVVDFDTASVGDQNIDLATFLTRLEGHEVKSVEAFCEQYELSHPGILDSNRIAWYQAVSFTNKAITSVKSLYPGIKKIESNLSQAEACLTGMG